MSWKPIVQEIRDLGMTSLGIAKLCGTTPKHIEHLLSGHTKRTPFKVGKQMLELRNVLAAISSRSER